jgi:hypothetical protein
MVKKKSSEKYSSYNKFCKRGAQRACVTDWARGPASKRDQEETVTCVENDPRLSWMAIEPRALVTGSPSPTSKS